MNAIDMLRDDHRHIKQLLKQLAQTPAEEQRARKGLVERLEDDFKLHSQLEEDVFYPSFKRADQGQHDDMRFEALEDHRLIDQALHDLTQAEVATEMFDGRAKALKDLVEHHIQEEEHKMFPLIKGLLDDGQLREIGHRMAVRRAELFSGVGHEGVEAGPGVVDSLVQLEERAEQTVVAIVKHPVKAIGRGVEEVVRVGANLAGEVFSGVRKGLTDKQHREEGTPKDKLPR